MSAEELVQQIEQLLENFIMRGLIVEPPISAG
jgi:hypothetical protein